MKRKKPDFELRPVKHLPEIRLLLLSAPVWLIPNIIPVLGFFALPLLGVFFLPWVAVIKLYTQALILTIPSAVLFFLLTDSYRICDRKILRGRLKKPIDIDLIEEIGAIEANKYNDFKEEIFIATKDRKCSYLPVEDFKEDDLRLFLAKLKTLKPDCKITYSDVIPLEARGLLRFLINSQDEEVVSINLTHTQFEEAVLKLVRSNEKFFWIMYLVSWAAILFMVFLNTTLFGDITPQTMQNMLTPDAASANNPYILMLKTSLVILYEQLLPIMTILCYGLIVTFGLAVPAIRLFSAEHLHITSKSIGLGMMYFPWEEVESVTLKRMNETDESLAGVITIARQSTLARYAEDCINIELDRVPDFATRQKIVRLVERFATKAQFNKEFLRTTTSITDIQFTELWLKESESRKQENNEEEKSLFDGADTLHDGKYKVKEVLGYGGQGTTYLVHEEGHDEAKVIKELILPQFADVRIVQEATMRFERAVSILESLDHPKIVKLHESFIKDGRAYIVLEYIPGKTLRDLVSEDSTLSVQNVCELGLQLCDILDYLHTREPAVIHCDFAPDNLIYSLTNKVKLVDFDVARVANSTQFSTIAGRPSYTPPEQFRGNPSTKSDLYALGAILKYLLTGVDPTPLSGSEIIVTGTDPESRLKELMNRCLAFEETNRPESAQNIKKELTLILADANIEPASETIEKESGEDGEIIDIRMRDLA